MNMSLRVTGLALFGAASLGVAAAEPISLPAVDYEAKATMIGGASMVTRHSKGKVRVDLQAPGMPQTVTSIVDLKAKKAVTLMQMPGSTAPMAMEVDFGDEAQAGVVLGDGTRVGNATVAGEACELWEVHAAAKGASGKATACLTRDSIPLRMEATVEGKLQTVFEVTELKRAPQDAKLFVVPANAQRMQMPKGVMPKK